MPLYIKTQTYPKQPKIPIVENIKYGFGFKDFKTTVLVPIFSKGSSVKIFQIKKKNLKNMFSLIDIIWTLEVTTISYHATKFNSVSFSELAKLRAHWTINSHTYATDAGLIYIYSFKIFIYNYYYLMIISAPLNTPI